MAISANRLKERNLVGLVTTDFIGSTDTGEDQPSNVVKKNNDTETSAVSKSNKQAKTLGKSSVFDKGIGNSFNDVFSDNDSLVKSINNVGSDLSSTLCNVSVINGKVSRLPENRDFFKQSLPSRDCITGASNVSIDSFLHTDSLFSGVNASLSDSGLYIMEQLIDKEFASLSGFSNGLTQAFKSGNRAMDVMSSVLSVLDTIGGTLSQKLNIINPAICDMTLPTYEVGDIPFLKKFVLGLALNLSNCSNLDKLLSFVDNTMGSGLFNKGEMASTIMESMNSTEGDAALRKVKIISALATTGDKLTDKDSIYTKGKTKMILEAIANSGNTTNSPASEYEDITIALNNTDSYWNKDKDGNPDFSLVKENAYIGSLANKTIMSGSTFDGTPTLNSVDATITSTLIITGDQTLSYPDNTKILFANGQTGTVISSSYVDGKTIIVVGSLTGDVTDTNIVSSDNNIVNVDSNVIYRDPKADLIDILINTEQRPESNYDNTVRAAFKNDGLINPNQTNRRIVDYKYI